MTSLDVFLFFSPYVLIDNRNSDLEANKNDQSVINQRKAQSILILVAETI